jgi:hypothetical protein
MNMKHDGDGGGEHLITWMVMVVFTEQDDGGEL